MSAPEVEAPQPSDENGKGRGGGHSVSQSSHIVRGLEAEFSPNGALLGSDGQCTPNYDESIAFLQAFRPVGFWLLTAIRVDKKEIKTLPFAATQPDEVRQWLEEIGAERDDPEHSFNIYFSVNPTQRMMSKKAEREDISRMEFLHVDIDPRPGEEIDAERARALKILTSALPGGVPKPTFIVDSGGGYHAYWKLTEPFEIDGQVEQYEHAKRYNLQLETEFGADACHNVDRIMRLPGTINRPDKRKREKGRKTCLAAVVQNNGDAAYSIDEFVPAPLVQGEGGFGSNVNISSDNVQRLGDIDELKEWGVPLHTQIVIVQGIDPDDPTRWPSRSEPLWYVANELVRHGVPDEVIYSVLTDPRYKISESVVEKGRGADKYARKQIRDAKAQIENFSTNEKGYPHQTLRNFKLGIRKLGVQLAYDEFADRELVDGLDGLGPVLDDSAVVRMWLSLEERFGLTPGKDKFYAIVSDMARESERHPVREYLDGLHWDGVPRLDRLFVDYFGAEESEYIRAVSAITLIAAVRRVRDPGCKFDEMPVLEGPQGSKKSLGIATLAVRPEWFSDDLPLNAKPQVLIESTVGKWIVEAGELKGMRKGDVESLKSLLSRQVDRARMAYGRLPLERARQFVILGTTNSHRYLKDNTGNRRFWPVKTGIVDLTGLVQDRDQLWAEAANREAKGESVRLDPKLYIAAAAEQEARHIEDPYFDVIENALGGFDDCRLRTADAWVLIGVPAGQRTQEHNARLGEAMRRLGWERMNRRFEGKPEKHYVKGSGGARLVVEQGAGSDAPTVRVDEEAF